MKGLAKRVELPLGAPKSNKINEFATKWVEISPIDSQSIFLGLANPFAAPRGAA